LELAVTVPEVILMAVGLSDLDGIRAARKIMQAKPVPVILVSSHYDAGEIAHSILVAKHRAEVARFWDVPPERIAPEPGLSALAQFEALAQRRLKAIWILRTIQRCRPRTAI
jgi:chemotaxis response regulator CheB